MKLTLKTAAITPQGNAWCQDACFLNSLSIRLWEKYKISKSFDPEQFYKDNFIENTSAEVIVKILKRRYKLRRSVKIRSIFYLNRTRPQIEKALIKRVPIICQVDGWGLDDDGVIVDGEIKGHYFVMYGFDDNYYYLQNPWGDNWYCKIKKQEKSRIGSFMLII